MRENIGMPLVNRPAIETIDVASTVTLTPEVRDILRILPGILFIESDDRLQ